MGLTKIQYTPEELQKKREEAERKVTPFYEISFVLKSKSFNKINQGEERGDRTNP